MKILLAVTKSELGGAQAFVLNLARGLKAMGEDVTVAGGPGDYLPAELEKAGIPFHRFQNLERSYNPFKIRRFAEELRDYVRDQGFTVVHLNSTNALAGVFSLAKLRPKPLIVFTVHGLSFLDPHHQGNPAVKAAFKIFFKAAWKKIDKPVFVSRTNMLEAGRSGLGGGTLIPNGLDFPDGYFLDRDEARKVLGDRLGTDLGNVFLYGSIGRLAYPKNYEFLIKSQLEWRQTRPEARLLLIGEGPERQNYEALIRSCRLEKEAFLAGEIKDASRYLRAFDVFVLPSVYEGLSLSLLEARAAGVPVLASRVGGNEEAAGAENCFALNSQAEFLEKMESLIAGQAGKLEPVSSVAEMAEGYARIYRG